MTDTNKTDNTLQDLLLTGGSLEVPIDQVTDVLGDLADEQGKKPMRIALVGAGGSDGVAVAQRMMQAIRERGLDDVIVLDSAAAIVDHKCNEQIGVEPEIGVHRSLSKAAMVAAATLATDVPSYGFSMPRFKMPREPKVPTTQADHDALAKAQAKRDRKAAKLRSSK